jgi:hypothetical protein
VKAELEIEQLHLKIDSLREQRGAGAGALGAGTDRGAADGTACGTCRETLRKSTAVRAKAGCGGMPGRSGAMYFSPIVQKLLGSRLWRDAVGNLRRNAPAWP